MVATKGTKSHQKSAAKDARSKRTSKTTLINDRSLFLRPSLRTVRSKVMSKSPSKQFSGPAGIVRESETEADPDVPRPSFLPGTAQAWLCRQGLRILEESSQKLGHEFDFVIVPGGKHLGKKGLDECFDLIEETSSKAYKESTIGWSPREKKREMEDEKMNYLLICEKPTTESEKPDTVADSKEKTIKPFVYGKILGFISFMYTYDDPPHQNREVTYIYEVHLREEIRGHGLGTALIECAEGCSQVHEVKKVMLTVFSSNTKAKALYERMGYSKDECSPKNRITRGRNIPCDFVIMSKNLWR